MTAAELPVLTLVDQLEAGTPIAAVADQFDLSPIQLVTGAVAWLAEHRSEVTTETHSRCCAVLSVALRPDDPLGGAR